MRRGRGVPPVPHVAAAWGECPGSGPIATRRSHKAQEEPWMSGRSRAAPVLGTEIAGNTACSNGTSTRNATLVVGREIARRVACLCSPPTPVPRPHDRCQSCERACTALAVDLSLHPRGAADGGGNCSVTHSTGPSNSPRALTTGPRAVTRLSSCRNATAERLCPRCHFSTGSPW